MQRRFIARKLECRRYGQFLTYLLVVLPIAWLAFAGLFGGRKQPAASRQAAAN